MTDYKHITLDDRVGDVMNHPAFEGFGDLLFTWLDFQRRYPPNTTMRNVADYDLWLTHPDAEAQVDGLNQLIDDVNKGNKVFYDIYTEEEKRKDHYKKYTGLVYIRGKPGAPFAVFLPGGGYYFVGMLHEGLPIAKMISQYGFNAFVLRYRVDMGGSYPRSYQRVAGEDLIRAVEFIKSHADELEVNPNDYSLWGGSAGAHTVSDVVYGEAGFTQQERLHPAAAVIAYTYFSDDIEFEKYDSPAFFIVGKQDPIVPWQWVKERADKMKEAGCIVEDHILDNLPHGFSIGKGTSAEGWIDWAVKFWKSNMGK